jgi:hemolysin activation/secretion protein
MQMSAQLSRFAKTWLLAGLVLSAQLAGAAANAQTPLSITGFTVEGPNPLGDAAVASLAKYAGTYTTDVEALGRLQAAARSLEEQLHAAGFGLLRVVLPAQQAQGVIKLQIIRFNLGTVGVAGNKFRDEANIRAVVPGLVSGQSPNLREVSRNLGMANEDPTRRLTLSLREGKAPDTIDANLRVEDSKPWVGTLAANNSGTSDSGKNRLIAALTHYNLLRGDETAGISLVRSPERSDVRQYGLQVRKPFYGLGGALSAYWSDSTAGSGALGSGITLTGSGTSAGVAWTQYLLPIGQYRHNLSFSLDDKLFRGSVITGGIALAPDVRSRPISIGYSGRYEGEAATVGFGLEGVYNLSGGGSNNLASYEANRPGASSRWGVLRLNADLVMPLPSQFALNVRARAQQSGYALISGEQFGAGGAAALRGVDERALTGDSGASLVFEVQSPPLAKGLYALAFVDGAYVDRKAPFITTSEDILTWGAGVRYSLGTQASLSLDYARVARGSAFPLIPKGENRLHGSVQWRF